MALQWSARVDGRWPLAAALCAAAAIARSLPSLPPRLLTTALRLRCLLAAAPQVRESVLHCLHRR